MVRTFHPIILVFIYFVWIGISTIPNGLGWSDIYSANLFQVYDLYAIYLFVAILSFLLFHRKVKFRKELILNSSDKYRLYLVFLFACLMYLAKFSKVGIPLLSDNPYLRTETQSLGGYIDYPTKLITITNIIFFYLYIKSSQYKYLLTLIIGLLLHLLFADRTQLVFSLIGISIVYVNIKGLNFKKTIYTSLVIVFIFISIAGVQLVRHGGAANIYSGSENYNVYEIGLWIVHGDLTGSQKFGAHITDKLDNEKLYGKYTLGSYASIVLPRYRDHGAEYLRKRYTNAVTAQSVGAPLSYFIDFGYLFVFLAVIVGYILAKLYNVFSSRSSVVGYFIYIILFINLLWSMRSGILPFDPIFIYLSLGSLFIFNPKNRYKINEIILAYLRLLYVLSMGISLIFLVIRL